MSRHWLVTGGAGFIGANYVHRLGRRGDRVTVLDNLSRPGSEANLEWLRAELGADAFELVVGDVRDTAVVERSVWGTDVVVHLAAQVAVTTSVEDPRHDFEVNALGTFNVLEAVRCSPRPPVMLYASTNKVYGDLEELRVVEDASRYRFAELAEGVDETQPLDLHSPYGCSKGLGDQYVRDYARIYRLPTVVLRQSCIYGPRQYGVEDQGWVAWFVIASMLGRPITVFGDGKQVRDLLWIDDLLDAYDLAVERIERTAGGVFNLGGGPAATLSVWAELGPLLAEISGALPVVAYAGWRPGDQRVFVTDSRRFSRLTGWRRRVLPQEGVRRLHQWVREHRGLFAHDHGAVEPRS